MEYQALIHIDVMWIYEACSALKNGKLFFSAGWNLVLFIVSCNFAMFRMGIRSFLRILWMNVPKKQKLGITMLQFVHSIRIHLHQSHVLPSLKMFWKEEHKPHKHTNTNTNHWYLGHRVLWMEVLQMREKEWQLRSSNPVIGTYLSPLSIKCTFLSY